MENITFDQKTLFLLKFRNTWLIEILYLSFVLPMGAIGTILNLLSLIIFLRKSLRNFSLFKYLIILSLVNSIIAFTLVFIFYTCPHIIFDIALSINGRIFTAYLLTDIVAFFYFFSNVIEIMINIERALYFSDGYQKFKKISPYLISFFIFILSLIIFIPNFWSVKMLPTDKIYTIFRISIPTDFALSKIGKLLLIICFVLELPVVFILLVTTNIFAFISYKNFIKRKEFIERTNNIEMMLEGELQKKKENEKTDRKMLIMTSYLSIISIVSIIVQFITGLSFYIITSLSPVTVGWLIFASIFSQAFKQFYSISIYYNYKLFRKELKIVANKIICRF
jgi:hypothetical protein